MNGKGKKKSYHLIKLSFSKKATEINDLWNLSNGFVVYRYINVQTMRKIVQIFVAFSEKLNFTIQASAQVAWLVTY